MVKPFSKSKRTPVRLRHKIEKASAAKQRKQRKEAKKNPQWKSRLKKNPGIPNLFPFKDKVLAEIEDNKRKKEEQRQRLREATQSGKIVGAAAQPLEDVDAMEEDTEVLGRTDDEAKGAADGDPMAALLASAQARAVEYDGSSPGNDQFSDHDELEGIEDQQLSQAMNMNYRNPDSSRKAFDKIFKQVLEAADVILYVIDARDPDGTRSREVERQIMAAESGSKRLILVLNKIDLVPPTILQGWLRHLKRYFPTIPLRATTPASNAQTFDHKTLTIKSTSESLLHSLKSYAAIQGLKRAISVGVIGYPNVGKSSVINALTSRLNKGNKSFACPVGSEAGVTTSLRQVKIDNRLTILDSPGIVFPQTVDHSSDKRKHQINQEARLVLLNALPPSQISDPIPAVNLLLERMSTSPALHDKLLKQYGITALGPFGQSDLTSDFLIQVARKRGRLGKGGVPNLYAAAMTVITDWRDGRIEGWVEAPTPQVATDAEMAGQETDGMPSGADQKSIVKAWSEEFKLDYSFLDLDGPRGHGERTQK